MTSALRTPSTLADISNAEWRAFGEPLEWNLLRLARIQRPADKRCAQEVGSPRDLHGSEVQIPPEGLISVYDGNDDS